MIRTIRAALKPRRQPTNDLTTLIVATAPMSDRERRYHESNQLGR